MDSPIITHIFQRLIRHRACHLLRSHSTLPFRIPSIHRRGINSRGGQSQDNSRKESNWQQRTEVFVQDMSEEFKRYPIVTADGLRSRKERPKRVKMLTRDFIEGYIITPFTPYTKGKQKVTQPLLDSLYNPNYGYFSKQVVIFSPGEPFDFNNIKDEPEFYRLLGRRYSEFEDKLDANDLNDTRQLWHTPTELFRPYYGEAIARYLVTNYKLTLYPYHDLIIYEMGAGNGTLMLNILDYIRATDPEVYARTKFRVIEISSALAATQHRHIQTTASNRSHTNKIEIINQSIFDWTTYIPSPCFFLALEVFDNFAHDSIRYDPSTEDPLQGTVLIDTNGDFFEFYQPTLDPLAARFLRVRDAACRNTPYNHPLRGPRFLRTLRSQMPFAPNLTDPEFIPTRLLQFFDILHVYFPEHKLVTSDFHSLPDTIKGVNAPVVQTRYRRRTVPVRTPYVLQGYFDILFPTDFSVMEDIYRATTGKLTRILPHEEFLKRWAYVEDTQTKSGESPLLSWYKNASVMTTV